MSVVILPARRRFLCVDGRFAVCRVPDSGEPVLLARFSDRRRAEQYLEALRQHGAHVELREIAAALTDSTGEAA